MRTPLARALAATAATMALSVTLSGRELTSATLAAYDRYVALTEQRLSAERMGAAPFLWLDRQPAAARDALLARLRRGEVVVERLETRDGDRPIAVPNALVHHWVGTVLIPGVSIDRVVSFVQDYDRYAQVFAPMIQQARVLRHDGDVYTVFMRTSVKKVVTVVMDADYVVTYHRPDPTRAWTTNVATHLFQIDDAGTPAERRIPGDQAAGYLWRFTMDCGIDARPDGVIEQCESVTLTRDVPFGVGWIVKPFVTAIPRETMAFTLGQVRASLMP